MNDVFADMIDVTVIIYLDDILIYSDNMSEHTKPMFRKYSKDSVLMGFLPELTSVSFMSLPVNTLDICCPLKASLWPHTKSRSSNIGPNPKKSRIFNPSSALPTSTDVSFMDTLKSLYHSHVSPKRVPPGTLLMIADQLLKCLKRLSQQHQSSLIGSQTPRSQSKPMLLTMHSPVLLITTPNGNFHPIAFHSQTFSAPQLNYNVHDKELLAIFEAFKQW